MKMVFHHYPVSQAEGECTKALLQLGFRIERNAHDRIKATRLDDSPLGAVLLDFVFKKSGDDAQVNVYSGVMESGGVIVSDPFLERMLFTRLSFDVNNLSLKSEV